MRSQSTMAWAPMTARRFSQPKIHLASNSVLHSSAHRPEPNTWVAIIHTRTPVNLRVFTTEASLTRTSNTSPTGSHRVELRQPHSPAHHLSSCDPDVYLCTTPNSRSLCFLKIAAISEFLLTVIKTDCYRQVAQSLHDWIPSKNVPATYFRNRRRPPTYSNHAGFPLFGHHKHATWILD